MLWVGIDEAGYGPNLGPLVMTAVIAKGPVERPPDVWGDLAASVCRAGEPGDRLWVDDSKRVYLGRDGRRRLDAACLAVVAATGCVRQSTFGGLLEAVGAGTLEDVELSPWIDSDPPLFEGSPGSTQLDPLAGAHWQIIDVRSILVGPARFNAGLAVSGSKAVVHFRAFAQLIEHIWNRIDEHTPATVASDKHGGRHYYAGALADALPDAWVEPGVEGPDLSCYSIRHGQRRLDLSLRPRADAEDGLVALASLVSKSLRERWMDAFNAHWSARLPDLKPTAGYPLDAARFRRAIEPHCQERGLYPSIWWRSK
jgi:ribonuclease HII